jgi:hypothetical protein
MLNGVPETVTFDRKVYRLHMFEFVPIQRDATRKPTCYETIKWCPRGLRLARVPLPGASDVRLAARNER